MTDISKVAAIFNNRHQLEQAIQSLEAKGVENISVLIKSDEDVQGSEVRTYSTATYPETRRVDKEVTQEGGHSSYEHNISPETKDTLKEHTDEASTKDPHALKKGATVGGVIGGLVGAAALLVPGIGTVLAAGPAATAMGSIAAGGAAGMTAGAITGLLQDIGLPKERVSFYRNAFDAGKAVLIVEPQEEISVMEVRDLINNHKPETLDTF